MTIDEITNQLEKVKYTGQNQYTALCPNHDDQRNSLSISQSDEGKILIHCHAGCDINDILRKMGLTMLDLFPSQHKNKTFGKIAETYDYLDENGNLLYQAVRYTPKDFSQRRPDGKDGWTWNVKGVKKVPYQLQNILNSSKDTPIFIVEGEKDANRLTALGLVATTNAGGAGKWPRNLNKYFEGRRVVILPDNDDPGRKHARKVRKELLPVAASIKVVHLPDLGNKEDVSDWLDKTEGTDDEKKEKLLQLVNETEEHAPGDLDNTQDSNEDKNGGKQSTAHLLLELAGDADLLHTRNHKAYAYLSINDCWQTLELESRQFELWLSARFYNEHGGIPNTTAISDAIRTLSAKAIFSGPERQVFIRTAGHEGNVYIDLGDEQWRSILVTSDGWEIVKGKLPVLFRRPAGYDQLPEPQRGGSIHDLRSFLNLRDESDWTLLVAWLLGSFWPTGPYPLLALYGEQGSAKSTLARLLRSFIDPNIAPLRSFPKDDRDLMIAAGNSWMTAFDNLSYLKQDQSDALCRLATGGGYVTRKLYTDDDETIFNAQRPIILNGIPEVTTKPDLADRSIGIRLHRIAKENRKPESELWDAFNKVRPLILGALLDILSASLRNLPTTKVEGLPRMADFAKRIIAAESYLDWEAGSFIRAYDSNREEMNEAVMESSPLAQLVSEFIQHSDNWTGTASDLLEELKQRADESLKRSNLWPKTPNRLGAELRRLAPILEEHGVNIEMDREPGGNRTRYIKISNESPDVL